MNSNLKSGRTMVVSICDVQEASFNPKGRSTFAKCRGLMESIRENGVMSPILVTSKLEIGDGHRRFWSSKELGMNEVTVRVIENMTAEEIYKNANGHSIRTNGNETLRVYLEKAAACPDGAWEKLNKAEQRFGTELMRFVADNGGSLVTLTVTKRILDYCGKSYSVINASTVAKWLLFKKATDNARWAMQLRLPGDVIWQKAINMELIVTKESITI
jgi:H2-forming N5,N10-methylenetetrahydromethanopterin dehydrogenase-like enzyme